MKFKVGDVVYCLDNSCLEGGRDLDRGKCYVINAMLGTNMCILKGRGGNTYLTQRFNYENQKHLF